VTLPLSSILKEVPLALSQVTGLLAHRIRPRTGLVAYLETEDPPMSSAVLRTDLGRILSPVAGGILVVEVHLRLGKPLGFIEVEGEDREVEA